MKNKFLKIRSTAEFLFMIGIIISSFVLINTADVFSRITKENKAISPYKEEKSICIEYTGDEISESKCEKIADKVIESAEKSFVLRMGLFKIHNSRKILGVLFFSENLREKAFFAFWFSFM